MNVLIGTAVGPLALSPSEAQARLTQLERAWTWATDRAAREGITREADQLRRAIDASRAYEDVYTPSWYVPGWQS